MNDMTNTGELAELSRAIKSAGEDLNKAHEESARVNKEFRADLDKYGQASVDTASKIEKMTTEVGGLVVKIQSLEGAMNEIHKWRNRPGAEGGGGNAEMALRLEAVSWLATKHESKIVKKDADHPFAPSEEEIVGAMAGIKAFRRFLNTTDMATLPNEDRKSLSAFSFGNNGFILAPEMSSRVLSCLTDQTDVAGLMNSMTISGPSVRFLIDNVIFDQAAWACEASCFANNPQPNLAGLGEAEFKPETLRYIVCATRDLLEDASINVEQWMMGKVARAFRATISTALISGDGVGRPMGILNPQAGIPICDTGVGTTAGQLTWQDLVLLKWQVPVQYHGPAARYFMNQNTLGLILTMSDASGRPIWAPLPGFQPGDTGYGMSIAGSPLQIVTQMPDVAPGATPVAFGNWNEVYMVVNRKAVTIQQDPYSAGFCILWKFESRVGGGIICPGAARLLRIR